MPDAGIRECPLCRTDRVSWFGRVEGREYFDCAECGLIHMAAEARPGRAAERAHYETHENDPGDAGYRAFLRRAADPLVARVPPGAAGLDYGSGPGPTLSLMLAEQGFAMEVYDPFFAPDEGVLARGYDFVTCTETVEHFFDPGGEFERLDGLVRGGGWLVVMTELYEEGRWFDGWRYARDPTHVCFYRRRTLEWIAARFGWTLEFAHRTVVLFGKPVGDEETG